MPKTAAAYWSKYTKPLFFVVIVFLKKWAQIKEALIKNEISIKNNWMGKV
jgi:hypothetical protein